MTINSSESHSKLNNVRNISLFSFESLKVLCKNCKTDIQSIRNPDGLDFISVNILNGENISIQQALNNGYPTDNLIHIPNHINLFDYKSYYGFKGDKKYVLSHKFSSPISPQITNHHFMVLLNYQHTKDNLNDENNFKISKLLNDYHQMMKNLITSVELELQDGESFSVSDYIIMFPTYSSLDLLFSLDPELKTLSKIKISEVLALIQNCPDKGKDSLHKYMSHVEILSLNNILDTSCPINNNESRLVKF